MLKTRLKFVCFFRRHSVLDLRENQAFNLAIVLKIKVFLFSMSLVFLGVILSHPAQGSDDSSLFQIGVNGVEAAKQITTVAGFISSAQEALTEATGGQLNYLNYDDLRLLRNEFQLIGFAGRSKAYDMENPEDVLEREMTRRQILSILAQLNPSRHILVGGGTKSGFNTLLSELGLGQGFRLLSLTSMAAAKYPPVAATHVYIDQGGAFGKESGLFARSVDVLFSLEGGPQTAKETSKVGLIFEKPAYVIQVKQGESIPKTVFADANQKIYEFGAEAVYDFLKRSGQLFRGNLKGVVAKANYFNLKMIDEVIGKRVILGVTSYAANAPAAELDQHAKEFADRYLDQLELVKDRAVLGVAGTKFGVEGYMAMGAIKRGIPVYAFTSSEVQPKDLIRGLNGVFVVADSWEGRMHGYVRVLDYMLSFGGKRDTILNQIQAANDLNKPWAHVRGIFPGMDAFLFDHADKLVSDPLEAFKLFQNTILERSKLARAYGAVRCVGFL